MGRRILRLVCPLLLGFLGAVGASWAQESATEFWPETDIWLRLSPAWRLSMFLPISSNIETHYREGSFIAQADYAWGKTKLIQHRRLLDETRARQMRRFLLRGGFLSGQSLGDQGEAYKESTGFFEFHFRTPLVGRGLLSHRLRADLRWLGDDHQFSSRLRYRLMVEREFIAGPTSIVPYVNVEPYYDSRYNAVNRVRLIGGASVAWSSHFALEANFTYQHDSRSSVRNLYAINLILHLYFETSGAKEAK